MPSSLEPAAIFGAVIAERQQELPFNTRRPGLRELEATYYDCIEWLSRFEVALKLSVSVKTVDTDLYSVQRKLGYQSQREMHKDLYTRYVRKAMSG